MNRNDFLYDVFCVLQRKPKTRFSGDWKRIEIVKTKMGDVDYIEVEYMDSVTFKLTDHN